MENKIINENDIVTTEKEKDLIHKDNKSNVSLYARFFNEGCAAWKNDSEFNLVFLRQQQIHANDLLKTRGYVFLNDVYDMLGIPRTKAGQVIGWIYDEQNLIGDNYIDFDIFSERNENFVNGLERSALLDFNVDGMILDRLP